MNNVRLLIWGNALGQSWPIRAIIFLYWVQNGGGEPLFHAFQWWMIAVLLLCEMPSSWMADRIGRTFTIRFSAIMRIIGIAFWAFGHSFIWFIVGEMFLGIAKSFYSGTIQAMLKESLLDENQDENAYRYHRANMEKIANIFQVGAVGLGAIIVSLNTHVTAAGKVVDPMAYRSLAIISFVMAIASSLCYVGLIEPWASRNTRLERRSLRKSFQNVAKIWRMPILWCVSMCFAIVTVASYHIFAQRQPYALEIGLLPDYVPWFEMIALIVTVLAANLAKGWHPDRDREAFKKVGLTLFTGMIACGIFAGYGGASIYFLLLVFCFVRAVLYFVKPIAEDIVQRQDIGGDRALVISAGETMGNVLIVLSGLVISPLLDLGLSNAYMFAGLGLVAGIAYFSVLYSSSWFRRV